MFGRTKFSLNIRLSHIDTIIIITTIIYTTLNIFVQFELFFKKLY